MTNEIVSNIKSWYQDKDLPIFINEPKISEKDIQAVTKTLDENWVSTAGPIVNEFEKSINNYKNALNLAPNDNGFFITEYLVASYYLAGKFEEIDRLVSPKVNLSDIKSTMSGIYSYVLLDKNEKKEAKNILLKAIKKGLTRKMLVRLIGNKKVEIFVEKLKPLGSLD